MRVQARAEPLFDLPAEAFPRDVPLVAVMRGEFASGLHRGTLAVCGAEGGELFSLGDTSQPAFLRSAAKPFQVMPAVLAGAIERFDITETELAVLCASHRGEERHAAAVASVLAKAGLDEAVLHCGVHPPLNPRAAEELIATGRQPTQLNNNCSGAHAGMLLACVAQGWPTEGYGTSTHPLQRMTRTIIAEFSELAEESITQAIDNCAVPTFRLPVRNAAIAFARLVTGTSISGTLRDAAARVVSAMTGHPEMVGGEGSFDTMLMEISRGRLLSKGGAEGFAGIGVIPDGPGLALKVSDGSSRAVPPTVLTVLDGLGLLTGTDAGSLRAFQEAEIRNHNGELVGSVVPVFSVEGGA